LIKDDEVVADHIYNADEMGLLWRCLPNSGWAGEVKTSVSGLMQNKD